MNILTFTLHKQRQIGRIPNFLSWWRHCLNHYFNSQNASTLSFFRSPTKFKYTPKSQYLRKTSQSTQSNISPDPSPLRLNQINKFSRPLPVFLGPQHHYRTRPSISGTTCQDPFTPYHPLFLGLRPELSTVTFLDLNQHAQFLTQPDPRMLKKIWPYPLKITK